MAWDNYVPRVSTSRTPDPETALRMFENKEAMDLNQLSDLLQAKFGKAYKLLTVKALKAQLKGIEQYSNNLFRMDDYRIPKHQKLVFPYELCCILLPLIQFNCTSRHETFDVARLLAHYDQIMNYISNEMDESDREYLYTIPLIQNYKDSRAEIMAIFDEEYQLNSLMTHLMPQNNRYQLPYIKEELSSLRTRCYMANLYKSAQAKVYIDDPRSVVKLLNHYRQSTDNSGTREPSNYPGLTELLECLTANNIDDVLLHYFIYKSITLHSADNDIVTPDELFKVNLVGFHVITHTVDIPERDKAAVEHFKEIQLKASQVFDKDDAVESFLYDHIIDIECLIFMRDVRSKNYFEQMKGRGTRVLGKEDLQKVTPSATENKDHFVIVDAVGVTKSKKTETRSLERKPSVSMKELMLTVAMGAKDEDTLTSLANRVIRLNSKMTDKERTAFSTKVGISAGNIAQRLLDAFDPDVISAKAGVDLSDDHEPTEDEQRRMDEAKQELIKEAVQPFSNPDVREYIDNVRRSHEQVIDSVNIDFVEFAGFDTDKQANAERVLKTFHEFIEANKDEILMLRIIYDQRYKDRPMAITQLKALYEKLKAENITIERLWECYAIKKPERVKRGTAAQLTDLISIIRFEMGYNDNLTPFADNVNYNFMQWTLRKNAGNVHFTEEQMEWLRLIKDHIAVSLSIEPKDLELSPFDRKGGLGRFYDVFGDNYKAVLEEMNIALVA